MEVMIISPNKESSNEEGENADDEGDGKEKKERKKLANKWKNLSAAEDESFRDGGDGEGRKLDYVSLAHEVRSVVNPYKYLSS